MKTALLILGLSLLVLWVVQAFINPDEWFWTGEDDE